MTRGIVYVAFGREYERIAAYTLRHSRRHTDLPFHVITNIPEKLRHSLWRDISDVTFQYIDAADDDNRLYKIKLYEYTPFDETLYLDVDSAIIREGINDIFEKLYDHDIVLARRFHWMPDEKIPEVYVRMFRLTGVRLPVDAYHGALFAFQKDNEEARRLMDLWWAYRNLTGNYRDLPPLVAAVAKLKHEGLRVGLTGQNWFTLKEPETAVVWHPQPGKPETWCKWLRIPDWVPWNPDNQRYALWRLIHQHAELLGENELPLSPCPKEAELCVTAYTFGAYNEYLPLLAFSTLWSYPEAVVKLFVADTLTDSVRAQFDYIRRQLSSHIEIVENYTLPVRVDPDYDDRTHQMGKIIRWLIPRTEFEGFRYVYMADSDFLIIPENPTLLDQHLMLMACAHQVYTNPQRWSQPRKVSGLHFVETEPYFDAMDPVLEAYRTGAKVLPRMNNEEFLHYALTAAGIAPKQQPRTREAFDAVRPHPGYHLGCLRNCREPQEFQELWLNYRTAARPMLNSPMFKHLVDNIQVPWVRETFTRLRNYLGVTATVPERARNNKALIVSDTQPKQPVAMGRKHPKRKKQKAHAIQLTQHIGNVRLPSRRWRKQHAAPLPTVPHTPPRLKLVKPPADDENNRAN